MNFIVLKQSIILIVALIYASSNPTTDNNECDFINRDATRNLQPDLSESNIHQDANDSKSEREGRMKFNKMKKSNQNNATKLSGTTTESSGNGAKSSDSGAKSSGNGAEPSDSDYESSASGTKSSSNGAEPSGSDATLSGTTTDQVLNHSNPNFDPKSEKNPGISKNNTEEQNPISESGSDSIAFGN